MKLKKIAKLNRKVLFDYHTDLDRDMAAMRSRIVSMTDNLGMMEDNAEKKLNKIEAKANVPCDLDKAVEIQAKVREMRHLHSNIVGMNEVICDLQRALVNATESMKIYVSYMEEFDAIMSKNEGFDLEFLHNESLAFSYSCIMPKSAVIGEPDVVHEMVDEKASSTAEELWDKTQKRKKKGN